MKTEHVLFPSFFFKITDPFNGMSFLLCSHDAFFGTNKNRILKNGLCEQALIFNLWKTRTFAKSNPKFMQHYM